MKDNDAVFSLKRRAELTTDVFTGQIATGDSSCARTSCSGAIASDAPKRRRVELADTDGNSVKKPSIAPAASEPCVARESPSQSGTTASIQQVSEMGAKRRRLSSSSTEPVRDLAALDAEKANAEHLCSSASLVRTQSQTAVLAAAAAEARACEATARGVGDVPRARAMELASHAASHHKGDAPIGAIRAWTC